MSNCVRVFLVVMVVSAVVPVSKLHAQVAQAGVLPFNTVAGGPDQVNLGDLSIHYAIPVFSRTGRGIPFSFAIRVDNRTWVPDTLAAQWIPAQGPGYTAIGGAFYQVTTQQCYEGNGVFANYTQWQILSFQDIGGTTHPFGLIVNNANGLGQCTKISSATGTSGDASGITLSVSAPSVPTNPPPVSVTLRDGSVIHPPLISCLVGHPCGYVGGAPPFTWTDSNGNRITYNVDSSGNLTSVEDTLGTTVMTVSGAWPNAITYSYTNASGSASSVTRTFKAYTVQTAFGCPGIAEFPATTTYLPDRITLPDGTFYQFQYEIISNGNTTGRLAVVTLPSLGAIVYGYSGGSNGIACQTGDVPTLTRTTPDSVLFASEWTYARVIHLDQFGQVGWFTTTVTDPRQNQSVYNFSNQKYEMQRQVYNGPATGTPIEAIITCYDGVTPPSSCATQEFAQPTTEITAYTSFDGGSNSEVDLHINSYGLPTEKDEYDFGAGTPTRKTSTSYATIGNGVNDRPSVAKITDGSGNFAAETDYGYDADVSSLQPSGASQLFPPTCGSGTCRGNVTSVKNYVTATTSLTKSFTHYDTGQVYKATDVNGSVATYTYSACGNSLLTNVALPLSLSTSDTWNCTGGVVASTTDANGQVTTYSYTNPSTGIGDPFWRITQVNVADGGQTTTTYNDTASPPNIIDAHKINSSGTSLTQETLFDTTGRPITKELTSDPSATDFVSTSRDGLGRIASISNPFRTVSDPTYGITQYSYDALGRPTQVTNPDNTTRLMFYSGAWSNIQDEGNGNGSNRIIKFYQRDGLGRVITVCEVTGATQLGSGGTPVSCGAFGANGFLTTYAYDTLDNLKTVTEGSETRAYTYDGLSRITSESNPEIAGQIVYTYDTPTKGDLHQRSEAKPNLPSGNGSVFTTYTFDALHRLTGISYNDGTTPWITYAYDQTSNWGSSLANGKGRLTGAFTCPSGVQGTSCGSSAPSSTGTIFSFDPVGRVAWEEQCMPANCGHTAYYFPFTYDYVGDLLSAGNGSGTTLTYSYNAAAELTGVTSSLSDANHPGTLLTNVQYNALGRPTSDTAGTSIYENYGYTNRNQIYTFFACRVTGSCSASNMIYTFNMQPPSGGLGFAPNGDVSYAGDWVNGNWYYTYDDFNRVSTSCMGVCPSQVTKSFSYAYDRYGNRWQQNLTAGSGPSPQYTFGTNNRISGAPSGCGPGTNFCYDAAGNLLNDSFHQYTYDGVNRIASVDTGGTATYVYDALGHRVEKTTSSGIIDFAYDFSGNQIAEFSSTGAWNRGEIYAGSRHFVTYMGGTGGSTYFNFSDWLGTERSRSDAAGNVKQTCTSLAFGDAQTCVGTPSSPFQFTGQQFDSENNLTSFWFRNFTAAEGRWMTPDPAGVLASKPEDPQTWNRYSYGNNNTLANVDLYGLLLASLCPNPGQCFAVDTDQLAAEGFTPLFDENGNITGYSPPADTTINIVDSNGSLLASIGPGSDSTFTLNPLVVQQSVTVTDKGEFSDTSTLTLGAGITYVGPFTQSRSAKLATKLIADAMPTVCGGGAFYYAGKEINAGPVKGFAGTINEFDSRAGKSGGALFEAGGGEGVVGGGGVIASGQTGTTPLLFGGFGIESPVVGASVGEVGFPSGVGLYAEGSLFGRAGGAGAYLNITTNAACNANHK